MSSGFSKLNFDEKEFIWSFLPRGTQPINREDRQIQRQFFATRIGELSCYAPQTLIGRLITKDPEFTFTAKLLAQRSSEPVRTDLVERAALTSVKHIEIQAMQRVELIRSHISLLDLGIDPDTPTKTLSYHEWNRIEQKYQQHCAAFCLKCRQFLEDCRRDRELDPVLMNQMNQAFGFSERQEGSIEQRYLKITKAMLGEEVSARAMLLRGLMAFNTDANFGEELLNRSDLTVFILMRCPDLIADVVCDKRTNVFYLLVNCFERQLFPLAARILNSDKKIDPDVLILFFQKYCKENNRTVLELILASSQKLESALPWLLDWCIEKEDLELGTLVLNRAPEINKLDLERGFISCIKKNNLEFGLLILNALRFREDFLPAVVYLIQKCIEQGNREFGAILLQELIQAENPQPLLFGCLQMCIKKRDRELGDLILNHLKGLDFYEVYLISALENCAETADREWVSRIMAELRQFENYMQLLLAARQKSWEEDNTQVTLLIDSILRPFPEGRVCILQ